MLSWSIEETNARVELKAITDPAIDPLIPGGTELLGYVDAVLADGEIAAARTAVVTALDASAAVDAAAVIGNFEMMNRIADGVGMPVGAGTRNQRSELISDLGLDRFPHA
jgi:hypothetical protein